MRSKFSPKVLRLILIISLFGSAKINVNAQLTFEIPSNSFAATLDSLEYFFNNDPGLGQANKITLNNLPITSETLGLNISSINSGVHQIYLRVKDSNGQWSMTSRKMLLLQDPIITFPGKTKNNVAGIEYFINTDPGHGAATSVAILTDSLYSAMDMPVNIAGLTPGIHRIGLRARDEFNNWSLVSGASFVVLDNTFSLPVHQEQDSIYFLEYFINNDPGIGNGHILAAAGNVAVNNLSFVVNIDTVPDGEHIFFVRILDQELSATQARHFLIGDPVHIFWLSFDAYRSKDEIRLKWTVTKDIDQNDYFIEHSHNGRDFSEIGKVKSQKKENVNYEFTDRDATSLTTYYRIKAIGDDGSVKNSTIIKTSTNPKQAIFKTSNPNTNSLTIFNEDPKPTAQYTYQIYSINGQHINSGKLSSSSTRSLDIGALSSGNYYIRIYDQETACLLKFTKL